VQSTENNGTAAAPGTAPRNIRQALSKQNAPTETPEPAPLCPCQKKGRRLLPTARSRESPPLKKIGKDSRQQYANAGAASRGQNDQAGYPVKSMSA
jgi:hypothetical protein